jgi:hypothetical protein
MEKGRTMANLLKIAVIITGLGLSGAANAVIQLVLPGDFPDQQEICTTDYVREQARYTSAMQGVQKPVINKIKVNGDVVWTASSGGHINLKPGDMVVLRGVNFGQGTDIDFSKIMLGNTRILETDIMVFEQELSALDEVNYETTNMQDFWQKNVRYWDDNKIRFRVPDHATTGPLIVQVQKRIGALESLIHPGTLHNVIDAQTSRIIDENYEHRCDVVSKLSEAIASAPIDINIDNPGFGAMYAQGEKIFWSYDYNIGLTHHLRNLDWTAIFKGWSWDPIAKEYADPRELFGAYKTKRGQVPDVAIDDVYFDPYPQPTPVPGTFGIGSQKFKGNTRNSGYVGYRYAESNSPFTGPGEWIGFNCGSCHSYQITFQDTDMQQKTKVFGGLPNPEWSMKWAVLQTPLKTFDGIYAHEEGPSWDAGKRGIAKDMLIYHMPPGAGEHNLVRLNGEGSHVDNDYQFSPVAFPNVTNYMAIRRSLSHTESYVGFEGSYVHAEEPDGAVGSMRKDPLQALTAYMTKLDKHDPLLINLGMYRWLKQNGQLLSQTGTGMKTEYYTVMEPQPDKCWWIFCFPQPDKAVTHSRQVPALEEGQFLAAGWEAYPELVQSVNRGKQTFDRDCGACHNDGLGSNTNEKMIRLDEVGRFFTPTIYQKETQSIRATFLRDMYWVQSRGLLSDGHVRNMKDLVSPARCNADSDLYKQYYTLHAPVRPEPGTADQPITPPDLNRKGDVFRVPKSDYLSSLERGYKRNRFIERHKYFVTVPWDDDHYYWDYQKMRAEYGPDEMGTPDPIGMPAAPHPWCAQDQDEVSDLVKYIMTL